MANTILQTTRWAQTSQFYLRGALVSRMIARSQFLDGVYPGYTVNFPYQSSAVVEDVAPGVAMTAQTVIQTGDSYNIDQTKGAMVSFSPLQNLQGYDSNPEDMMAGEIGYQLANFIDQYALQTALNGAYSTITGGTLDGTNIFEALLEDNAALSRSRALLGAKRVLIADPTRITQLALYDAKNGFNRADAALRNGYVGETSAGFSVYESLNLPFQVALTLDTQPTAGEFITLQGKVWTFVATGTATLPGDISIGGSLAATQTNVIDAINGTGTPGAGTYVDFNLLDRQELQQQQVAITAFVADVAVVTGYGELLSDSDLAGGANGFGTETGAILTGCMGALDLTVQAEPTILRTQEPRSVDFNLIGTTQFGAGVFRNFARSLAKITFNVA